MIGGSAGVLVTDVHVRKVPVAGAARVYDLRGTRASVVQGPAHLGRRLLVDREVVVHLFVMRERLVDQGPTSSLLIRSLVNWSMAVTVEEGYRDDVGGVI